MTFCDACETCSHCLKKGCIPLQPAVTTVARLPQGSGVLGAPRAEVGKAPTTVPPHAPDHIEAIE